MMESAAMVVGDICNDTLSLDQLQKSKKHLCEIWSQASEAKLRVFQRGDLKLFLYGLFRQKLNDPYKSDIESFALSFNFSFKVF